MKLNEKDVDIESTETLESIDFSIDMNSLGVLMKGFSDNLYSNKIGSIVREIASNCFDAHAEVGNTDPVEIEIVDRVGEYQITFRDFGPGLSPERIRMVYSKYFSSTKRDSNNEIGGFGIGAKSPFSYTDSFIVKTWVDNVEYHYIMHRGVTVPEIKLIYKAEVEHKNSTEIVIPIKNSSDLLKFKTELKSQLKYFDNIDYLGACGIENDYNILQIGPTVVREGLRIDAAGSLEVCIGKVRYPLDRGQLPYEISSQMSEVSSSMALKFEIGEISVTMTRESIEYTDATIGMIAERFKEAQTFFSLKYAEYLDKGAVSISSYIAAFRDANPRLEFPTPTGMCSLSMKGFLNSTAIP
jgi:anti-sigma regulatory factor (Ser/Thr protein kinase)